MRGIQSGGVAATLKHFVCNDSETGRFTVDVRVSERALREMYLAPFEAIVRDSHVWAVMAAYNSTNGVAMTEHPMLRDVLKDQWEFDGVVISDWYACRSTDASARAALDLAMPGPTGTWGDALLTAVRSGQVSEGVVDDKVLRLLRLAARVGALEETKSTESAVVAHSPSEIAAELRGTAASSFVLARNHNELLPLSRSALRRVAIIGQNAAAGRAMGGGSATVYPPYSVSPLEGLRAALGPSIQLTHAVGAHCRTRLPAAAIELLRAPRGDERGVEIRFLAADDSLLSQESRDASGFVWLGSFGEALPFDSVAAVEMHTELTVAQTGLYTLGCSGVGRFILTVGGEPVFDKVLQLHEGADPAEKLSRPPQHGVSMNFAAGDRVSLVLRHELRAEDRRSSFVSDIISVQLNIAAPAESEETELAHAVDLAAQADAAVIIVGTTEEVESEGFDRDSLALPGNQDELIRRVSAANPRTVLVVNSGAPVLIPTASSVPAVIFCWFPGQEFGNALADVLLGAAEPGGRLPTTWPASESEVLPPPRPEAGVLSYDEDIYVGYRWFDKHALSPAFPFGHGLGYTRWQYLHVTVVASRVPSGSDVRLRVRIRNIGLRRGSEVVQVYLSCPDTKLDRPRKWLAGFAAVSVGPSDEAQVDIVVPARAFCYWDTNMHTWQSETGIHEFAIGSSSADIRLRAQVMVS